MLTKPPKCRAVCKDKPGEVMDELATGFRKLRAQGVPEQQALCIARDPMQVARLLPPSSIGALPVTARALVDSGCAECAVNLAYTVKPEAA